MLQKAHRYQCPLRRDIPQVPSPLRYQSVSPKLVASGSLTTTGRLPHANMVKTLRASDKCSGSNSALRSALNESSLADRLMRARNTVPARAPRVLWGLALGRHSTKWYNVLLQRPVWLLAYTALGVGMCANLIKDGSYR